MSVRNSPCSCGSGKKYKKCCLIKLKERQAREAMMQKHNAVINSKCPECDSGKKWKDCCLAKHIKEQANKDTKLVADTGSSAKAELKTLLS